MKCEKCGNELMERDIFCPICGASTQKANMEVNYGGQPYNYTNTYDQFNNNYQQDRGRSKNKRDILIIFLVTLVSLVIVLVLFLVGKAILDSKDKQKNESNLSQNSSDTTIKAEENIKSTSSMSKTNSYKVNFDGFTLYIPDTLMYQVDYTNNMILVEDMYSTWAAQLGITEGSFQKIKQNRHLLVSYFVEQSSDITVLNSTVETINGVEYILVECNNAGSNLLMGYAPLNSMYTLGFALMTENNDFDRSVLENLSPIISNAEYTGNTSYMKSNENINLIDVNAVLNKVLETSN